MKYLMFVCSDTEPDADPSAAPDIEQWVAERDGKGQRLMGSVLAEPSAATTVRVRDGELLLTDGPFAETKEQLGGFWVIQCDDLDQALAWGERCALACGSPIEVRPFEDAQWT